MGQIPVSIESEMKKSYMDYAMSVIVSRAIPDVRDGLKPVHRRILYSMYHSGYYADKPHRKSARIIGDVIGKYHPHGDSAVYDSLVRMAQDFSLRVPLVDGQGNFGSMDGDSAAAMRYTESKLAKISHYMLDDIDKETVNFQPNYDAQEEEPTVLPAKFPNLLVNGSGGIAVGMATNIPPHNLGEVIDACCHYIDNPNVELIDLIEHVHGPDFPTGGIILGKKGIHSAYLTGRGSIAFRGRTEIESIGTDRERIVITEMPFMVNKAKLVEKIAELVQEKRIEGISDLRDESNKDGVRVVIDLKKSIGSAVILNQLYSYTQLQTSFGVIMLALDGGMPKVMNLKEIIEAFVNFRQEVITRRTLYLLNKDRARAHLLLGLMIAVANIDEVIRIIKASSNSNEAKDELMSRSWECEDMLHLVKLIESEAEILPGNRIKLTEAQTRAILEMRLQRLTAMEKNKISEDIDLMAKNISHYMNILNNKPVLMGILKEEMLEIKEKFSTKRLTEISDVDYECDIEELIQREEMVVTVTLGGYIKRVPLDTYRLQKRGGRGRLALSVKDEDITTQLFVGNTHTPMLFFSNLGKVYSLKLYQLPLGSPQSKGRPMVNLLPLIEGEAITNTMPMPENEEEWDNLQIMFATSKGNIRRNDLSDFKKIQSNGKIAIRLEDDDTLVNVQVCNENDFILLATKQGKALHCPVDSVRIFKSRTSDGVRGMKLAVGDVVISMAIVGGIKCLAQEREAYLAIPVETRQEITLSGEVPQEILDKHTEISEKQIIQMAKSEEFIITVAENGFGKLTSNYEYRVTNRGGSGILNMAINNKTGTVVTSLPVPRSSEMMLITDLGQIIRISLANIRITSRKTSGVILFKTQTEEKIVSVSLVAEDSDQNQDDETLEENI